MLTDRNVQINMKINSKYPCRRYAGKSPLNIAEEKGGGVLLAMEQHLDGGLVTSEARTLSRNGGVPFIYIQHTFISQKMSTLYATD